MPNPKRRSTNNVKKIIKCVQCKTPVLENEEAIDCDICKRMFHWQCTQLNKLELERLVDNDSLEYKCHICEPRNNGSELKTILQEMREMKETIKFMSSQYDQILTGVKKNTIKIKTLQKQNKRLNEHVNKLQTTVNFLNNQRVQNNCIINGVNADANTQPIDVVLKIVSKAGCVIDEKEIDDAYFINRNMQTSKTAVVVKFANKKSKALFMKDKKNLKDDAELKNVFVNDFLTKDTLELLKYAKSLKTLGYKYIYTRDGKIFTRKDTNARSIQLRSLDDVDNILKSVVTKQPVALRTRSAIAREEEAAISDDDEDDDNDEDDYDDAGFLSPN
ncbi:uncharacterized protein [Musca autumnalis]|uniref:uncharacterized protein n=1 Tax=Musca autumnalis TaxID=221902 RepID=UPI003CED8119